MPNPLTLFHRSNFNHYPDTACDLASVGVIYLSGADKGKKAGFVGASWGEHPTAPDCLHIAVLASPDEVEAKLTDWGLQRDPNQTDFPPEPPLPQDSDGVV